MHLGKIQPISTFDFSILYTTILHKLLIKVLLEVVNFAFQSKCRMPFLKQLSIGFLRELEEDTLLKKLLSMLYLFS